MRMAGRLSPERERRDADLFWASLVGEPAAPARPFPGALRPALPAPPPAPPAPMSAPAPAPAFRMPSFPPMTYDARPPGARAYEDVDNQAADLPSEAMPAGLTASPCDISKTSETLDQFALNSSALIAAHTPIINRLRDCLVALQAGPRPIRNVDIVGFTDPSGSEAHNQRLGEDRAKAVRKALSDALPAAARASFNFRIGSRGETQQIPGGNAANRRVEVFVEIAVTDLVVHATDPNTHEIPSNLGAAGLEHFCCVRNTGPILIEALISPNIPGNITGRLTWGPAASAITVPGVGTDGRTARLSSAAHGKFPIEVSWDGTIVRRAVVWVIWSTGSVTCTRQPRVDLTTHPGFFSLTAGIDHMFVILPRAILFDPDHPALEGPPTAAVPGAAIRHIASNNLLAGGAARKWDVSRQVKVRILNPRLYPVADLPPFDPLARMYNGQPVANRIAENYPANDTIGNDDSNPFDETNDPYTDCQRVTSTDDPSILMPLTTGANGDTFEMRIQFREFLRVNLGPAWYRASDFSLWRFHPRFRRTAAGWTNDNSTFAQDNAGF
jgi:outer membrane protein OmpA-like peptidoglycan-associated protein